MSLYEALTLLISVLAVAVSVVSLVRTRRVEAEQLRQGRSMANLAERQLERLEEQEQTSSRAHLSVELVPDGELVAGGRNYAVVITNRSGNPARNVRFEFIDTPRSPLLRGDYESKIPAPFLQRDGRIRLFASITHGKPLSYRARVLWQDPDGAERSEEVFLSA